MTERQAARLGEPWIPDELSVLPIARGTTRSRPRGSGDERQPGKERPCWDVRWRVDGQSFFTRFHRASEASVFADELRAGRLRGWAFDPAAKRFRSPEVEIAPTGDTVFSWTEEYWQQKWRELEPKSRHELARYLNRARAFFVALPPGEGERAGLETYLKTASLGVRSEPLSVVQKAGETWLRANSLPLAAVGRQEAAALLAHFRFTLRDPDRQTSPATERRMVADLKQCWKRAVLEDRLAVNPWDALVPRTRRPAAGGRATAGIAADAETVLSPDQIFELADTCVSIGSWGESVRAFVLVMGLCGLRPNEAVGLVVGDIELPADGGPGWLTARRTHRQVPERYLDVEEDPTWGPLKGRDLNATRRVPIPTRLTPVLLEHLAHFCAGANAHDLVFQHNGRPFDLSVFGEEVWSPARAALFPRVDGLDPDSPLQPKLSRLGRQDLRHSACSMWLRAHVDVTVCQLWSGHKRLSVFLDVYQGLIPDRVEEGVRLLEEHLA